MFTYAQTLKKVAVRGALAAIALLLMASSLTAYAAEQDTGKTALTTLSAPTDTSNLVAVYRLYNPNTNEHFFTTDANEKRILADKRGWVYENIAFYAPKKSNKPVYRLYHPGKADHHYTTDIKERNYIVARSGWRYEGIAFYSADNKGIPIYRLYKGSLKPPRHHYTADKNENNVLAKSRGWRKEGVNFYAAAQGKSIKDGWIKSGSNIQWWRDDKQIKDAWVIVNKSPYTNLKLPQPERFRIDANGNLKLGFFKVGDASYYGIPKKGYVVRGAHKIDATHALIADNDGKLYTGKTGWLVTEKYDMWDHKLQRYYIERTTANKDYVGARIGLFKVDGKQYYGYPEKGYVARLAVGRFVICDGKLYEALNEHGHLKIVSSSLGNKGAVVGRMYNEAQKHSSSSKYLLMVDIDDCVLVIFEGKKGAWKIKKVALCGPGKPSTPTPVGTFKINKKWRDFTNAPRYSYTCYSFSGFLVRGDTRWGFHTRIYNYRSRTLQDARIGIRLSAGCVRLYDEDANWIYRIAPMGTTVVNIR